jgi:hypothetical protein
LGLAQSILIERFKELAKDRSCIFFIWESVRQHAFQHANNFTKVVSIICTIQINSFNSELIRQLLTPKWLANGVFHQELEKGKCVFLSFVSTEQELLEDGND